MMILSFEVRHLAFMFQEDKSSFDKLLKCKARYIRALHFNNLSNKMSRTVSEMLNKIKNCLDQTVVEVLNSINMTPVFYPSFKIDRLFSKGKDSTPPLPYPGAMCLY